MFNRDAAIQEVNRETSAWLTVRDWIRDMVRIEPKVMREVSKARFGDLGSWIQNGSGNVKFCGCLVGTCALKLVQDRNHFKPQKGQEDFVCTEPIGEFAADDYYSADWASAPEVVSVLAANYGQVSRDAYDAGIAAAELGDILGQTDAVKLIKDEIIRQLKFRQKRIRIGRRAKRSRKTGQFA